MRLSAPPDSSTLTAAFMSSSCVQSPPGVGGADPTQGGRASGSLLPLAGLAQLPGCHLSRVLLVAPWHGSGVLV